MTKPRMAPEGWPFVLSGIGVFAVLALLGWTTLDPGGPARAGLQLAAMAAAGLTLFTAYFFRDPLRVPPKDPWSVLAPADGRVLEITEVEEGEVMGGAATRITIFLSIFNVHVQRAPLSGKVVRRRYKPGLYLAAWNPKASQENEQASLGLATDLGPVMVRQIAGLVARRVVTDPQEGDSVRRGERIGLIRFGSRVDLFLPPSLSLECAPGDRVKAGLTVVATAASPPDVAAAPPPDSRAPEVSSDSTREEEAG